MKDNKRIIEVDGIKYSIDKTFDGSPTMYKKQIKSFSWQGKLCHVNEEGNSDEYTTDANSLINRMSEDCVLIIARKV